METDVTQVMCVLQTVDDANAEDAWLNKSLSLSCEV